MGAEPHDLVAASPAAPAAEVRRWRRSGVEALFVFLILGWAAVLVAGHHLPKTMHALGTTCDGLPAFQRLEPLLEGASRVAIITSDSRRLFCAQYDLAPIPLATSGRGDPAPALHDLAASAIVLHLNEASAVEAMGESLLSSAGANDRSVRLLRPEPTVAVVRVEEPDTAAASAGTAGSAAAVRPEEGRSGFGATAAVGLAGLALAGAGLFASGLRGLRWGAFTLALAPAFGFGFSSLLYFLFAFAGLGRPRSWSLLVFSAAALFAVSRFTRLSRDLSVPAGMVTSRRPIAGAVSFGVWSALVVTLLVGGRELFRLLAAWPEGTWDAVAIWNVRARFLYHGWSNFPDLLAQVVPSSHPHYPLFLPGAIAAQWAIAGGETVWTARLIAAGCVLGVVSMVYAAAAEACSPVAGALAAALVAGTPLLWIWGAAQVADVAIAYLFLGALVVIASQLGGYPAAPLPPLVGGAFLGLLAWTKNEGWVMAAISIGLGALALGFDRLRGVRRPLLPLVLGALAGAAPGLLALLAFKLFWAPGGTGVETFLQGDWAARLSEPQRWLEPIRAIVVRFLAAGESGAAWYSLWPALLVAALAVVVLHRGCPPVWLVFWASAIFGIACSWVAIYAVTPYEQAWHIASSLDRLLLQVMPATAAGVVLGAVTAAQRDRGAAGVASTAGASSAAASSDSLAS